MTRAILYFLFEMVICGPLVFGNVMKMEEPFSASNDVQLDSLRTQECFECIFVAFIARTRLEIDSETMKD